MRRRGWSLRLAEKLPEPLLAAPERVALNLAMILIGISFMWPPPGSAVDSLPDLVARGLASLFVLGGALSLHSMWTDVRYTERAGALALALACFVYAGVIIDFRGITGLATILLFIFVALSKVVRWIRSTAFEQTVRNRQQGRWK
jgi:hypothetical protein